MAFAVNVTGWSVTIHFSPGSATNPTVDAIEIH
jgi:hypothetical protein